MAIIHRDIMDVELNNGTVFRTFAQRSICEGDNRGNRFGLRVLLDGEVQDISTCTVTGFFIRSDGVTLVLEGEVEDGAAIVELPPAAYAKEGNFSLAIKVSRGNVTTDTMRIVDGTVVNTTTAKVKDPGNILPDLSELAEELSKIEQAITILNSLVLTPEKIVETRYRLIVTEGA